MSDKRVLVIAGSDSSGGAGLEADQKVIAAHGCYAMTATTALTAQNTMRVFDIQVTPPEFVRKQIDACIDDIGVDVVKTGMLASAETVKIVVDALRDHQVACLVVDPVMVSTTGSRLLPEDAIQILREQLLPITTILTPNVPEAKLILQNANETLPEPESVEDIVAMARRLQKLGPQHVLLKGGHLPLTKDRLVSSADAERHMVLNVLCTGNKVVLLENKYLCSKNTHGTGCSLASAIASNLALGIPVVDSVKAANLYVEAGIKTSVSRGKGSGPINHFHSNYFLPFSPGGFVNYLLTREDVKKEWNAHTEHEFVKKLANGTLPIESFKHYLIQDYLFLIHFSRAHALAAYKAKNLEDINRSASIVNYFQKEVKLHLGYCKEFGIPAADIEKHKESIACTAYTRYILDVGQSEDWFALQVALLPCLLGYSAIAKRWYDDPNTLREGNSYWAWFEMYNGDDYNTTVDSGCDLVEKHATKQSVSRVEELANIFIHSTRMEIGFWDMSLERK